MRHYRAAAPLGASPPLRGPNGYGALRPRLASLVPPCGACLPSGFGPGCGLWFCPCPCSFFLLGGVFGGCPVVFLAAVGGFCAGFSFWLWVPVGCGSVFVVASWCSSLVLVAGFRFAGLSCWLGAASVFAGALVVGSVWGSRWCSARLGWRSCFSGAGFSACSVLIGGVLRGLAFCWPFFGVLRGSVVLELVESHVQL